jgi:hypothetical protein
MSGSREKKNIINNMGPTSYEKQKQIHEKQVFFFFFLFFKISTFNTGFVFHFVFEF